MAEQRRDEKSEKPEEKQEEKGRGEKEEKEEKSRGEKWQRDPVSAAVWASILIWAGLVLLAATLDVLVPFVGAEATSLIFIGAGVIVIGGAIFRLLVPAYRQPVTGSLILGIILLAIGLGSISTIGWAVVGPLALVLIGVYLLLRGLFRRR